MKELRVGIAGASGLGQAVRRVLDEGEGFEPHVANRAIMRLVSIVLVTSCAIASAAPVPGGLTPSAVGPIEDRTELERKGEAGDPHAQYLLGEAYLVGINTVPDYALALKWLERSVAQDYPPAKFSLANMYLTGRGVPADRRKAIALMRDAADQGYVPAQRYIEIIEKR